MLHTRPLLAGLLAIAAVAAALTGVRAEAPFSKAPPVGYYRMPMGDFEVTALLDGVGRVPARFLTDTTLSDVEAALARNFLEDPVSTSINAYLINTGAKLVLVDAGAGTLFGPRMGRLGDSIRAAGYRPEQVDEVYITHMHADHVGGLMTGDKRAFPNAIVRADKNELDYWLSRSNMEAAPKDDQESFKWAMDSINPYIAAGRFKAYDGDTDLVPGIRAVASRGQTAGHTTFVVESKGGNIALWGDLIHVAAVQFPEPSVTILLDKDSKAAAIERKKAFAAAAARGYWVAGAHLGFPGIGHLRAEGIGYVFIPANYAPSP